MSVEISSMKQDEAQDVNQFLMNLVIEGFEFPQEAISYYEASWSVDKVSQRVRNPLYVMLTARKNGEIVGLLLGAPPEGGVATIVWLLVAPDLQQQGIGTCLFNEACFHYKKLGCHKIKLTVPNKRAANFIKSKGCRPRGAILTIGGIWTFGLWVNCYN